MSRFHNLGQRLAAADTTQEIEDENETSAKPQESKKKDDDMSDSQNAAAVADAEKKGHEAGFSAANDRMNTVFASEHYVGREAMAAKLLGKPSMSAEDIVDVLADTPKAEKSALTDEEAKKAAEEAGRKEMKDALAGNKNSDIDANGGGKGGDKQVDATAVWDKAIALNNPGGKIG